MSLKIFDYRCENHHVFEAWLRSEEDVGPSACPVCGSLVLSRLPSAPAVKAAEASASSQSAAPAASLSELLTALRHAAMKARDVGEGFPERCVQWRAELLHANPYAGNARRERKRNCAPKALTCWRFQKIGLNQ